MITDTDKVSAMLREGGYPIWHALILSLVARIIAGSLFSLLSLSFAAAAADNVTPKKKAFKCRLASPVRREPMDLKIKSASCLEGDLF